MLYFVLGILVIAIVVVATVWYLIVPDSGIFKKDEFNKKLWQEDVMANQIKNPRDCQRGRMAQHVIDAIRSSRLTRSEVINMLGEPVNPGSYIFQYDIGWCGYIDPNTLNIEFTENGHVSEAYIINH